MKSAFAIRSATTMLLAFSLGCLCLLPIPRAVAQGAVVLYGYGTATIDGTLSRGEWDGAGSMELAVNLPEGGTAPGRLYVMNDSTNLYLAIQFLRRSADAGNTAVFEFDKDHSGSISPGDDVLILNPEIGFYDSVRTTNPPCPPDMLCGVFDTDVGGQNDGAGAFLNDGTVTVYEFSHPLKSADAANDIQLEVGQSVGFTLFLRLFSNGQMADTDLSPAGTIVVATEPLFHVGIDIRPGEFPNNINPRSHGKVAVALLSGAGFDATSQVDPRSLTFGRSGDEPSFLQIQSRATDVNGDGRPDLVCLFSTERARFKAADKVGVLRGRTRSGLPIEGSDSIRIVP